MASDVIEMAGRGGEREAERSWREYLSAGWWPRANLRKMGRQPRGRRGDRPCDAFRTGEGTRGASRGPFSNARSEDSGPNRKSRLGVVTGKLRVWAQNTELHSMNSEALKRVLSRPRLPYAVLGLVGILAQAFYSHTPIGIEGDAAGYIELGRFLGGIPGSSFIYFHRPPAYPAFLILTGFIHLNTFRWTLLATAAIGVLCPLLVYSIVSELGRYYALGAALIYVVSTLPFSYSNLLLAEHLYTFLILVATSATCLYLRSGRPAWRSDRKCWTSQWACPRCPSVDKRHDRYARHPRVGTP